MPGRISKHSLAVKLGRAEQAREAYAWATFSTMMSRCVLLRDVNVRPGRRTMSQGRGRNASPEVVSSTATTTNSSLA